MALLALDHREPSHPPRRASADLRWVLSAGVAGIAAVSALGLAWGLLAPNNPTHLVQAIGVDELAVAGPAHSLDEDFDDELSDLYASVEGPQDARYAGIDTQVLTVAEGDTLANLLQAAGAAKDDASLAVKAIAAVYDPRQIKGGHRLTVTLGIPDNRLPLRASALPALAGASPDAADRSGRVRLMSIAFKPDVDKEVVVRRDDDGSYTAEASQKKLTAQLYRASGVIDQSLFLSAAAAGVPDRVTSQLMYLYSYDVDFQRDVQSGDSFEVFFTRYFDEFGNPVKSGDIMFAALTLSGKRMPLYRYVREPGAEPEYVDDKGRPIKKSLLSTPIESARITSGFGMRMHPVLGYTRMHKGIDFGAPEGTPILASGDGVVEIADRTGGYGNYVRIRHTAEYETAYGHMSAYGRGIRAGAHVRQGQVIGYVGQTGVATGPHLHYEILIHGDQVNPKGVQVDTNRPLDGQALTIFLKTKNETDTLIAKTPLNAPVETAEADTIATELRGARN
ncbi:MAG: M23 family metallopeptidase [Alphaproteobacteria bacterium]|nr:M23 family metallopeptidase [Alphaproteobacteria bacterium]